MNEEELKSILKKIKRIIEILEAEKNDKITGKKKEKKKKKKKKINKRRKKILEEAIRRGQRAARLEDPAIFVGRLKWLVREGCFPPEPPYEDGPPYP